MKKGKPRKLLGFKCPKCGASKLDLVYDSLTALQEVAKVYDDASVYVTGPIQVVKDNGHVYRCHDCETSLVRWDIGEAVWLDDSVLVDWLKENCPQEDRGTGAESKEPEQT